MSDVCPHVDQDVARPQTATAVLQFRVFGPVRVLKGGGDHAVGVGNKPDTVGQADNARLAQNSFVDLPFHRAGQFSQAHATVARVMPDKLNDGGKPHGGGAASARKSDVRNACVFSPSSPGVPRDGAGSTSHDALASGAFAAASQRIRCVAPAGLHVEAGGRWRGKSCRLVDLFGGPRKTIAMGDVCFRRKARRNQERGSWNTCGDSMRLVAVCRKRAWCLT
jgi:hypothetical protein